MTLPPRPADYTPEERGTAVAAVDVAVDDPFYVALGWEVLLDQAKEIEDLLNGNGYAPPV